MFADRYIVNVEGAIVKDGRYLMVVRGEEEYAPGGLNFPGGKVEGVVNADDVLEETLRREIAEEVGLAVHDETAPGLHEHERPKVGHLGTHEQFVAQAIRLFEHPGELVFGSETADQAHARFAAAVASVLEQHPSANPVIVSHGTVMTLFIAHANQLDLIPFWKNLGLPAFAVLSLPDLNLLEVIESVESNIEYPISSIQ